MSDETSEAVDRWRAKAQSDWTTVEILHRRCPGKRGVVSKHCPIAALESFNGNGVV